MKKINNFLKVVLAIILAAELGFVAAIYFDQGDKIAKSVIGAMTYFKMSIVETYDSIQATRIVLMNKVILPLPSDKATHVRDIPPILFDRMLKSVVKIKFVPDSVNDCTSKIQVCGTGTVIYSDSKKSYILTNRHIAGASKKCGQIINTIEYMDPVRGETVAISDKVDLALIRVDKPLLASPVAKRPFKLHQATIVIGCPWCRDWFTDFGFVTKQEIRILGSWAEQLASHTYPGNSGSPVFNMRGELNGVIYAEIDGMNNIGFNVVHRDIEKFLNEIGFPNKVVGIEVEQPISYILKKRLAKEKGTPYLPIIFLNNIDKDVGLEERK